MSECPFCDYKGRSDHVKRHLKATHHLPDVLGVPLANGRTFKSAPRKPYVIVSLIDDGSSKSGGVCMRCHEIIPHTTGGSRAMYASHCCKMPRGATMLPPIPDMSFVATLEPVTPTVSGPVSNEINWDAVLKDLEGDAGVKSLLDKKRFKEVTLREEDDEGDAVIEKEPLAPRDVIIDTMKCMATLKRCNRLEQTFSVLSETCEQQEQKIWQLEDQLRKTRERLDNMTVELCSQLQRIQHENTVLKQKLLPNADNIEHA